MVDEGDGAKATEARSQKTSLGCQWISSINSRRSMRSPKKGAWSDIAQHFEVTELQRLAIANLYEPTGNGFHCEEIVATR